MPIYVYRCRTCGNQFDKLVRSFSATTTVECPQCGTMDTERRPTTFATAANGSGGTCIPSGGG